jgi:hypothetical protein
MKEENDGNRFKWKRCDFTEVPKNATIQFL